MYQKLLTITLVEELQYIDNNKDKFDLTVLKNHKYILDLGKFKTLLGDSSMATKKVCIFFKNYIRSS